MQIADAHVHVGKSPYMNGSLTIEGLNEFRKTYGVKNALVMSLDQDIDKNNAALIKLAKGDKTIKAFYWMSKHNISTLLDALEIENGALAGVKFHGRFDNLPITSPIYEKALEILAEKRGKILVHTGRFKEAALVSNTSYLHALEVARNYPQLTVIMAHMGGSDTEVCKRALMDSKDQFNVYFDTCGITTPYIIEYAIKVVSSKRILFGSDYPYCSFNAMKYNVIDAKIADSDKQDIMERNFNRIFNC